MFVRLCGLGLLLAGFSVPTLLAVRTDDDQDDAATAASEANTRSTQPQQSEAPAAPAEATINTSGLLKDLAGKYLAGDFSTGPLSWEASPLTVLVEGNRLAGWLDDSSQGPLHAELVSAQFSRKFLESYFQHAVERDSPVDDEVLGLRIAGRSHVTGEVHLVWHSPDQLPGFDLIFAGVCRSQTDGLHEVVTLHNQAETQFEARKSFFWTSAGLEATPAVATAQTHSKTVNIDSPLRGFVGRIATGIAHERANDRRAQADAISSQHAAQKIARGFDERVDRQMAVLRLVSHHLPVGGYLRSATRFELASTAEALHAGLYRLDAEAGQTDLSMSQSCDAAIRLHRGVFQIALADWTGLYLVGAVLLEFLSSESDQMAQSPAQAAAARQVRGHWQLSHSADGQWLLVEHISPAAVGDSSPPQTPLPTPAAPVSQQRLISR